MDEIQIGLKNRKTTVVSNDNTAKAMKSGTLDVFATPAVAALAEACCAESVEDLLDDGVTSVGTHLDLSHLSASPLGAEIRCDSELVALDGRKLDFTFEVFDNAGVIAKGDHTRFLVRSALFLQKANEKLTK